MPVVSTAKPPKSGKGPQGANPLEELQITSELHAHNVVKSNKRFAAIWVKWGLTKNKEATRLQPQTCGVSELNRIPNMPYCHVGRTLQKGCMSR